MSKNNIIIGIGGTGGSNIKEFRKLIHEQYGSNTPTPPERVRYLYVDSDSKDLKASSKWKTQQAVGEDIALDPASLFFITENNVTARLEDPVHYPVTHRYMGSPNYWKDLFNTMNVNETAGGQMRRLGLALFEPRCKEFITHVEQALVKSLQTESGQSGVTFHICAGLAGGTGSGTFLQIAAQLRRSYPDSAVYPIFLYLLLPEEQSNFAANGDDTNYYANGSAALQELNAYLCGDTRADNLGGALYSPLDMTGTSVRLLQLKGRLQGVFIATNLNEEGHILDVKKDMPTLFAQLLYQRIFRIDGADPEQFRPLLDAVSLENLQVPDETKQNDEQVKLRSVRFQTFGTKRIMVPEEEIRDHFTATIATQSLLQMRYNHWQGVEDGASKSEYKSEARNISFAEQLAREDIRLIYKIANNQVTLSTGILANEIDASWKPHDRTWDEMASEFKNKAWSYPKDGDRDVRLEQLEAEFETYYYERYRGMGVDRFFSTKSDDLGKADRHIAELRNKIETSMMTNWQNGEYSAADLEVFLNDMLADLEKRLATIPTRITKLTQEDLELTNKVNANTEAWTEVGFGGKNRMLKWTGIFTTLEDVFEAQSLVLLQRSKTRTWLCAWNFAAILIKRLHAELRDKLLPELTDFRSGLDTLITFFDQREKSNCPLLTKVEAASNNTFKSSLKFYEPKEVRTYSASLLEEKTRQEAWAGESRRAILAIAEQNRLEVNGRERPFSAVATYAFRNDAAIATQERVSRNQAEQCHDAERPTSGRFIGVNIVTKLFEKYPTRERLLPYLTDIVASAQTFNRFRNVEITRAPTSVLAVILPKCDHLPAYRDLLKQTFIACQSAGIKVSIVDSSTRVNEITLISFKYAFPLRYLEQSWYLKEKFDYRLKKSTRASMEVFSEDHRPPLPSLFRALPGEAGDRMLPMLQITHALGLFKSSTSLRSGQSMRYIALDNKNGLPETHYYPAELVSLIEPAASGASAGESESIIHSLKTVTESQAELLEDIVSLTLKQDKYRQASERESLKVIIRTQLQNVCSGRLGDQSDPVYLKFRQSSEVALNIIDQLA